ncbi:MAG: helix-turn-helix domain-containing protein [Cyanobacteria bacterium]|nr:helix-turn-helix domain-containing protein [Cyanobacteriota bacterium]
MPQKGRPRLALESPASLQLFERAIAPGPCVLGPILRLQGPIPGAAQPAPLACRPDQLQLRWPAGLPLDIDPPGWRGHAGAADWILQVPLEQLLLAAERRGLALNLVVDLDAKSGQRLAATAGTHRLIEALADLCQQAERGLTAGWLSLEPELLDRLVDVLLVHSAEAAPRQDRGWRHVIEALVRMERGLAEELSLADLSKATGVSPRALQMAFRRHLDKRPLQSLRELRLARLRRLLLQEGRSGNLAEVQERCGLPGNGTTARHYGERYGEKPSQTRA